MPKKRNSEIPEAAFPQENAEDGLDERDIAEAVHETVERRKQELGQEMP